MRSRGGSQRRNSCARSRKQRSAIGATGLQAHAADARRHLARDTGFYDVIFLDPPFATGRVDMAAARVRARGSRAAGMSTPKPAARLEAAEALARLAPRQGGCRALSSVRPGRQCCARGTSNLAYHDQSRLSRHLRPVHVRPRGPRASRVRACSTVSSWAWPTASQAPDVHGGGARVDGARGAGFAPERRSHLLLRRC
mgnify:CR=1 FL=1